MNEFAHIFVCIGMIIVFGFALTYQNYGFLKDDIKYLEKRITKLESEILEIKYRR